MTFLPDVNVWVAIAVAEHEHHDRAARWLESTHGHSLAFCRVTQMGFLRLLTNVHVMKGDRFSPGVLGSFSTALHRKRVQGWSLNPNFWNESGVAGLPWLSAATILGQMPISAHLQRQPASRW